MKPIPAGFSFLLTVVAALCLLAARPAHAAGPVVCSDWAQVNDGAFGMSSNFNANGNPIVPPPAKPYASEEGFEVLVFEDRLYVGMEADNLYGARLWRTTPAGAAPDSQDDWEEVIADAADRPFGVANITQNDHVDSLAAFDGYLYVSTANGGSSTYGTQVWRSPSGDPGTWTQVNTDGFGDVENTNFKDMQIFDGWLCGGTQNWEAGAQVWCTADGTSWVQKNHGGFGASGDVTTTVEVWSGYVYGGALYFGAQSSSNGARLFRTTDLAGMPTWTEVYAGLPGSYRADILGDLAGYLYISHPSSSGIVILRSATGDPGTWAQVNTSGMNGNPGNSGSVVDGGVVHAGALYIGVTNVTTTTMGAEVWRTAGVPLGGDLVDWTQVGGKGLGDPNNGYTELIPFRGDLYAWTSNYVTGQQVRRAQCPAARNVILLIGDGMGANHLEAARRYYGAPLAFDGWADQGWISTYPADGGYDPAQAWSNFDYVKTDGTYTDSAAAATALYTGVKTANDRINVSADGTSRLFTLADKARALGKAVGAVSTVPGSDATPGAWMAHNASRTNRYAIADEGLWGDPNTTGFAPATGYSGGQGATLPPVEVFISGGHPMSNTTYINAAIRDKLADESGDPGAFTFVERIAGQADGGARLLAAANTAGVTRLAGLFGGTAGNIEYRLADGSGHDPENPTLAEMAQAALTVLDRDPDGFVLIIEGGAIDWAAHNNRMDQMLGEVAGFNAAVQTVVDWVDANDPAWSNTLVVVTADHETGYLTAGPGVFPTVTLGTINDATLAAETIPTNHLYRASWDDANNNDEIDPGETVHWAWNTGKHTNSLVRVYARGAGASFLAAYATGADDERGAYGDNTDIFRLLDAVTLNTPPPVLPDPPAAPQAAVRIEDPNIILTWPAVAGATGYQVWRATAPYLNPGDPGALPTDVAIPEHTDTGAAGAPYTNDFYAVRAVGAGGASAIGPRVGLFQFELVPGQAGD